MLKKYISLRLFALVLALGTLGLSVYVGDLHSQTTDQTLEGPPADYLSARKAEAAAIPDAPTALPESQKGSSELAYMVQLGEKLIRETNIHPMTAPYIPKSDLTCTSCHLDAGKKKAIASTFIGTAAAFPAFNKRDGGVVTLQDRINSCFMRSMNGTRLPANSEPMLAMVSYITWLSEGFPLHMNANRAVSEPNGAFVNKEIRRLAQNGGGDIPAGKALYRSQCASCHGMEGSGFDTEGDGHFESPPVWGPRSYNQGAGLFSNVKGASWVQFNMPPGEEFSLGNQEALDIMSYVNSQPHPNFVETEHLPEGGRHYDGEEIVYHYGRSFSTEKRAARD